MACCISTRRAPWPAAALHWPADVLLAQVPLALDVLDYLQRRIYRPIPQAAPFRVQFYFAACRQGLLTPARPIPHRPADGDLARWRDPATPCDPVTAENPTAWAQHPGSLALMINSAFPAGTLPVIVAAPIAQRDLDAFLLE